MGKIGSQHTQSRTIERTPSSKQNGVHSSLKRFLNVLRRLSRILGRNPVRSSICILGILLGASAAVVGAHDLLSPRAGERVAGILFLIGGVPLAVSAVWTLKFHEDGWATRDYDGIASNSNQDNAKNLAFAGFLLGLIPGATLLYSQLSYSGYSRRVLLWLLVAAIPAVGAVVLWKEHARLNLLQTTGSITLLAAALTLLPSLLGGAFRPVVDPSFVDAQMNTKVIGHRRDPKLGNVAILKCTLTVKNRGKRRLMFVGSLYTVQGVDSKPRKSQSESDWPMASELRSAGWSGRFESPWDDSTAVEVGYDFAAPGDTLEPGQQAVFTLLPIIPSDQYDTAQVHASIATAFDDRLKLGEQKKAVNEQELAWGIPVEGIWDIEQTSWVAWLTQGPQDLRVAYFMEGEAPKFTGLYAELGTGRDLQTRRFYGDNREVFNPRAFTTYGLGWSGAGDSLIVDSTNP
jgi:hypothetical protein